MEVILREYVRGLGERDEVVRVKDGYARNYLIPTGRAVSATVANRKQLAETLRQRAHKEAGLREEALRVAASLEGVKLTLGAKTSSTGRIFGSVNTIQIAEGLAAKGIEVDRKRISIPQEPIKEVGTYRAVIRLYKDVSVEVEFEVISE